MNIKKLSLSSILLLSINSVLGAPVTTTMPIHTNPEFTFTGIYLGIQSSITKGDFTHYSKITADLPGTNNWLSLENRHIDNKVTPLINLHLGIGQAFQTLYLGGEIFVNNSRAIHNGETHFTEYTVSTSSPDTYIDSTTKVESSDFEYGVDLRPGYLINSDLLLYGRVGVIRTKFSVETLTHYARYNTTTNVDSGYGEQFYHRNLNGWRIGAGIEKKITQAFSWYLDYTYVSYHNINNTQKVPVVGGDATDSITTATKICPSNSIFSIGLNIEIF
jgi:opacity protein-like surface antigen